MTTHPALIPLRDHAGTVVAHTTVDAQDVAKISRFQWRILRTGGKAYVRTTMEGKQVYLHRFLLDVTDPKQEVDHINSDGLDNRRANLRTTTHAGNLQNRRGATRNSTSGFRGVSYMKQRNKWRAYAMLNGKHHHLGVYPTAVEAAAVSSAWREANMPNTNEGLN